MRAVCQTKQHLRIASETRQSAQITHPCTAMPWLIHFGQALPHRSVNGQSAWPGDRLWPRPENKICLAIGHYPDHKVSSWTSLLTFANDSHQHFYMLKKRNYISKLRDNTSYPPNMNFCAKPFEERIMRRVLGFQKDRYFSPIARTILHEAQRGDARYAPS